MFGSFIHLEQKKQTKEKRKKSIENKCKRRGNGEKDEGKRRYLFLSSFGLKEVKYGDGNKDAHTKEINKIHQLIVVTHY